MTAGKGKPLAINEPNRGGTSTINAWKIEMERTPPAPIPVFKPLRSWPFAPHERQSEIDAIRAIPSWKP